MKRTGLLIVAIVLALVTFFTSCSNDDDYTPNNIEITQADKDALLFMLEEEKLARDTIYKYNLEHKNVVLRLEEYSKLFDSWEYSQPIELD